MESDFEKALSIAIEDNFYVSRKGMEAVYDLFVHLSKGGTLRDYPDMNKGELDVMLGAAYNSLTVYAEMSEKSERE